MEATEAVRQSVGLRTAFYPMNFSWPQNLSTWLDAGLGFLFPNVCQICHSQRSTAREGYVCGACFENVRFITAPFCKRCGLPAQGAITNEFECSNCQDLELRFDFARAAVVTNPFILEVIHRYKYQRALWFEPFLASLLVQQASPQLSRSDWDLIVPVPLHPAKRREREFNQAERLAIHLARATGIPVSRKVLKRIEPTRSQTALSRSERTANVAGAFSVTDPKSLKGQRIVLIDDIFTTGATTNSCSKILLRNGSCKVCVWTVARGL
jgi:competence protein ComFC